MEAQPAVEDEDVVRPSDNGNATANPGLIGEAFLGGRTPAVIANRSYRIVTYNQAFQVLLDTYAEAFDDAFGDEASSSDLTGHPVDLLLEGTGYRRALRKSAFYQTSLALDGLALEVTVRRLPETEDGLGGFLVEFFEPTSKPEADTPLEVLALSKVVEQLSGAKTTEEAVKAALSAIKEAFGWAYASYWRLDPVQNALVFHMDVGVVNDEFHRVTASASFREGEGLSGRAWQTRELVFVADLGEVTDCCRRVSAQRAGVKSGLCLPVLEDGQVKGTMDFFVLETLELSEARRNVFRTLGRLVSSTLEQIGQAEMQRKVAEEASAFRSAVDCSSNPLMLVDDGYVITYLNPATRRMLTAQEAKLRQSLPGFSVDGLVGTCIDNFHKNPSHQRRILDDDSNYPYVTRVKIADMSFDLVVSLLENSGRRQGLVAEWQDVTAEVEAQGRIEELLRSATEGHISGRLECQHWEGFTNLVGEGMNELLDAIQQPLGETKRVITALSAGDLTQSASDALRGEFAEVADALNESILNLREVISQIVVSGDQIGRAASELADGNAHLNGRTQQQAAALEETAATIEELTGTVKQNADNAQEANTLAAQARELAEKGGEVVGRAVSAMAEINRSSKKISDIIGVIDEIAFQTNLLALNAAVEAARAGDQGRGFAVVATEVRNLAQRSAAAAKEIKTLIGDSVEKVEDGTQLVDSSGQTLREIMEGVKRVSDIIAEIAAASEEQAVGIDQVNKAVAQMDEMTQQNAAMVQEATSASSSMHEQALSLGTLVGRFVVGQEVEAGPAMPPAAQRPPPRKAPATPPLPPSPAPAAAPEAEWEDF